MALFRPFIVRTSNCLALDNLKRRGRKPAKPFVIVRRPNLLEELIQSHKHSVEKFDSFKFEGVDYKVGDDLLVCNFYEPEYPNVGKLHAFKMVKLEEDCRDSDSNLKKGGAFPVLEIRW